MFDAFTTQTLTTAAIVLCGSFGFMAGVVMTLSVRKAEIAPHRDNTRNLADRAPRDSLHNPLKVERRH